MRKNLLPCLCVCLLAAPVFAVKTAHWVQTTEADFKAGTFNHVVTTNFGDVKLSREVKTLLGENAQVSAVYALAQAPDGTIYAGTGPEGILLAVKDDKVSTVAEIAPHTNIYSLMFDAKGRLLIGTGGDKGEIYRIDKPGEKPQSIFSSGDVQYVWSMTQTSDGNIYAATGPNGQLIQINPDDTSKILLDSDENNLLCVVSDGKDNLFVGTDPDGLVYRVNRKTGDLFVVYDAPESEISSLALDAKGNLYASTAQASEEPPPEQEGSSDQIGRPETDTQSVPIPSHPPANPKPPENPKPQPNNPPAIPKKAMSMSIITADDAIDQPNSPTTQQSEKPRPPANQSDNGPETPPENNGNAIYRIDPDGFVTEVFRQPVTVYSMLVQGDVLLVATGNEGNVYQVDPAAEETSVIAKVDPKHVMCLLPAKDGRVFMGLADSGDIAAMTSGFATDGTFVSPVLDATQISRFGKIHLTGTLPHDTTLKIATRSGNVEDESAPGWSKWSDDIPATEYVQVPSPTARYMQYRLSFSSESGKDTPIVNEVDTAYQVPNLPPQIKSIKVAPPDQGAEDHTPTSKLTIAWEGSDPNEDELAYTLYFRSGTASPWILLKDKLKDPTFDWDTRNVGDGRYEIKVVATDAAANPPGQGKTTSRVSDPVLVDNTPPEIGDIATAVTGADVNIKLNVVDRTSTVARLEYSVDSSENWQTVLPSDKIADSPQEAYDFAVSGVPAGAHQIALRATDAKNNRSFESVSVTVEKMAAR